MGRSCRLLAWLAMTAVGVAAGLLACGFDGQGSRPTAGGDADAMPNPPSDGAGGTDTSTSVEGGSPGDGSTACTLDDGGAVGTTCAAKCVDTTRDRANCGGCGVACGATAACEGACVDVATALVALRYDVPCTNGGDPYCSTGGLPPAKVATLKGTPGKSYVIGLRVRGVVEQKSYTGEMAGSATGTNASFFVVSGTPVTDFWNAYRVQISAPAKTAFLNSGASNHDYVDAIDYRMRMTASAGATLSIDSPSTEPSIVRNKDQSQGNPIVIPGIKPAPMAFNGQFIQIDVEDVLLAP